MNCDNFSVLPFDVKSDCANLASNWNRWLCNFPYMVQGRVIAAVDQKRALLLHLAGPDVQDLYKTLVALEGEEGKDAYDITVGRLNNYFAPKSSKTFEHIFSRKLFNNLVKHVTNFLQDCDNRLLNVSLLIKMRRLRGNLLMDAETNFCADVF